MIIMTIDKALGFFSYLIINLLIRAIDNKMVDNMITRAIVWEAEDRG